MKNLLLSLFLLFLPSYLSSQGYFYYYQGEKQFLELDTGYVFVSTVNKSALQGSNLVSKKSLNLNKERTSPLLRQRQNIETDFYWTELELSGSDLRGTYTERVGILKQIDGVQVISPYFKGKSGKKIGLSNFFYVKLKSLSDTTLLNKYSVDNKVVVVKQDKLMPLWFVLSCTKETEKNAMEMANKFYESRMFQFAEPDLMVEDLLSCTNDPYFSDQWGLRNTGQYGGTAGIDIKACDAWQISTGAGVTVAVIDHGIELNHPDLQANMHPLSFDTETGTSPSIVWDFHGVPCAGIIGAIGNNSAGMRGVAPSARLMSISNRLEQAPNIRQQLAAGINWTVQNGADVISNSWGSDDLISALIDDAITNAITNGRNGLGCVVVFATGNDNGAVNYPANSNPAILAVGAISPCGQRKSPSSCDGETNWGSNFGRQLDIVAPGVLVPTTDRQGNLGINPNMPIHTRNGGNKITSDYTNRDYTVWFNGTSAACPHVAGVAALILSVRPDLREEQVRNVIEQTAQKVGGYSYANISGRPNGTWHQEMGYGLVNAYAAVNAIALRINGPTNICWNEVTYTIERFDDLPEGSTVQWSANSSNLELISGQGPGTATFRKKGNGMNRIDAEININGNIIRVSTGPVYVGMPAAPTSMSGIYNGQIFGRNGMYSFSVSSSVPNITEYEWTIQGGQVIEGQGTSFVTVRTQNVTGDVPVYFNVSVRTLSDCGWSNPISRYGYVVNQDGPIHKVYPNPATDMVTVEVQEVQPGSGGVSTQRTVSTASTGPYEIQLWSSSAMLRRYTTDQPVYQISVSGLPAGIYFVRIIKDGQTVTKKLIKR